MPTAAQPVLYEPPWIAFSGGLNGRDTPTKSSPVACFAVEESDGSGGEKIRRRRIERREKGKIDSPDDQSHASCGGD
ncbi:hypothetical protein PIB30_024296 [Stylosanthes scabra]|uniref:Uncharacterized protein n=1 Tax=Stylosanthes scabra TaxID=79078 RepID=A0ABU6X829_9FABA|nr:hypothetical protein [Stylosanthes scabra]